MLMIESDEQLIQKISDLLVSNTPIVLFVGKGSVTLSPSLLNQPWSCIITSLTEENFAYKFEIMDKRNSIPIVDYEDMLDKASLNQRELNVIYLFGTVTESEQEHTFRENQLRKSQADKMVNLIPELLKGNFGSLFIVGYDTSVPDEVDISVLYNAIVQMRKGSAFLFGASDSLRQNEYICDIMQHGQLHVISEELSELILNREATESLEDDEVYYYAPLQEKDSDALYVNKKRGFINRKDLFDTRGFVRLLTETEVGDTSCPHHLKAEYFYTFLKDSVSRPIWLGYENGFNLKRNFEPRLEKVVKNALAAGMEVAERQPILLVGQTSSSKTIAMGALAYKIYCEKEYPVLFINNPNLNMEQGSPYFMALDTLLKKLEELGARKVLLVWDNSSSLSQIHENRKLQTALVNRGRKVVLVSTAYEHPKNAYKGFEIIEAEIKLTGKERNELQDKVFYYCNIPTEDFENWIKRNDEHNLLTLLYTFLNPYVHSGISRGLQLEISWGMDNLFAQMERVSVEEKNHVSDIALAFQNAGYTLSDFVEDDIIEHKTKLVDGIRNFCNTVAVSSQRKIPLPLSLALRCMNLPLDNQFAGVQAALFDIPFLQIISPELDASRYDYWVAFRTPLEAEIYLRSANITPEQQINYIVEMILGVSVSGEYNKYSETSTIERLIRVIGPNCPDSYQKFKNRVFKQHYSRIIDALTDLRVKQRVYEPRLICQEVAWMREVYGSYSSNGSFDSDVRKGKLEQAIEISRNTINKIDNQRFHRKDKITKNNLIVESALSELKLYDLYNDSVNSKSLKIPPVIFNFREISQQLNEVIASDPTNTYPYNALLRLFIAVYNSDTVGEEDKVRYLSNVTAVIDDVESQGREVEDNEEYAEYKAEILRFESEEKYKKYYNDLLKKGFASGVHLTARKMLADAGIDYRKALDGPAQKEKAQEIVDFLKGNMTVVLNHPGCMYMLISLTWILYNGDPIFSGEELQFTHMNLEQWEEIKSLCVKYVGQFLRGEVMPFNAPTIYYLQALAYAQMGEFQRSLDSFSKINETMFYTQIRTKVWHIICEENGTPQKFNGTIDNRKYDPISKKGRVSIEKIPARRGGVFFYGPNLHLNEIRGVKSDFEIGTSYIGFTAYRQLKDRK